MKGKVILSLVGLGVVISLFKIQSISYHKQIEKLQSDLSDAQIKNQILQADLKECKQFEESFKAKNDKMLIELLADFNRINKNFIKKGGN
jgi:multidrug resistance efflux pump